MRISPPPPIKVLVTSLALGQMGRELNLSGDNSIIISSIGLIFASDKKCLCFLFLFVKKLK